MQEGTPREIYENPRSRFVAEFVGKSNLFAGTVTQAGAEFVEIESRRLRGSKSRLRRQLLKLTRRRVKKSQFMFGPRRSL